jgi:hypothetical protein
MALGRRRKGIWPCLVQRVKPPLGVVFEEAEILEVEVGGKILEPLTSSVALLQPYARTN